MQNFVVCHVMLKRDNRAVSSPLFSSEDATNDLMDIIDDCHPEDLIEEKIKSLQSLLESPNQRTNHANGGVCNIWDVSMRAGHEGSSSASSGAIGSAITGREQDFFQGISMDEDEHSAVHGTTFLEQVLNGIFMDEDEHSAVHGTTFLEQVLNGIFMDEDEQTAVHKTAVLNQFGRQTVIKENRQTQTVKSLHGILPVDEKEGFIEDTSRIPKPPACMPPLVCPSIMSKSEGSGENSLQKLNTNPRLIKNSVKSENIYINSKESGPLTKVKMESTSSGTAPGKAKINLQAMEANTHATAASLIQKKQLTTSSLEILKAGQKLGQETKLKSETRSVSFCSTYRGKECSCNPPRIVYLDDLLVGIIVLIVVVLYAMFNL